MAVPLGFIGLGLMGGMLAVISAGDADGDAATPIDRCR